VTVTTSPTAPVHLIARWTLLKGREQEGIAALKRLVAEVLANEPDTLTYSFHTPSVGDPALPSLPASNPQEVVFYEAYRNKAAFEAHVKGPTFTRFLQQYGELFLSPADVLPGKNDPSAPRSPFVVLQFLELQDGFTRQPEAASRPTVPVHYHPSVMFEILAQDQGPLLDFYQALFGWEYQFGAGNFAYVKFPSQPQPLMGGIGQGDPAVQGFEPGRNFYLLVDDLQATLDKAAELGGSTYVEPTVVDGYHCAMMRDPQGNIIGLIEPFTSGTGP
jgi:predicted enzyme related to lactoylglutathione lyase/quinol monooxygenase YgiN